MGPSPGFRRWNVLGMDATAVGVEGSRRGLGPGSGPGLELGKFFRDPSTKTPESWWGKESLLRVRVLTHTRHWEQEETVAWSTPNLVP